jgi:hypothetical protein
MTIDDAWVKTRQNEIMRIACMWEKVGAPFEYYDDIVYDAEYVLLHDYSLILK